jgi:ferredoxin-type protein NapF
MNGDWDTWRSVMARQINPASLPRGRLKDRAPPLRPPWALGEAAFTAACECCGNCVEACPEKVLTAGASGYPEMDFARGGCNFCAACVACRASSAAFARSLAKRGPSASPRFTAVWPCPRSTRPRVVAVGPAFRPARRRPSPLGDSPSHLGSLRRRARPSGR